MLCLWLALAVAQADDAKAIEEFRAAYKSADEDARVRAVDLLAGRGGAKAIPVLSELLGSGTERVRVSAARAIGAYDDAAAVEAVGRALETNAKSTKIVDALVRALEEIDRESGAALLHALLRKHDKPEMFDAVAGVLRTIGKIGSVTSVEPLLDLLRHAEKESADTKMEDGRIIPGSARHVELQLAIQKSLRDVTGGRETRAKLWDAWWTENAKALLAARTYVFRCPDTGKRWEQKTADPKCTLHDESRRHGELVKARITP
jgi:HEAT repeat protein